MKKKLLTVAACMAMSMALCACNTTGSTGAKTPTEGASQPSTAVTLTPAPTATPSALEEAYKNLPVSDYDDYVATTVLPEGYIGFEIAKITDAEVDAYVQEVLENNKNRELKETPLENGDIAIIDYTGYIDGVTFEGGSEQSRELELGSGAMIAGFEEGLIGAKKGDTVVLNLKFPEDYYEHLAGKDVMYEVKIRSSAAQILPEFTDEFVTELTGGEYTTTEDFRLYSRGFLQEGRRYNEIMDYLVENTVFNDFNEKYIQEAFKLEKEYWAMQYLCESVEELEEAMGEETIAFLWEMVERQIRRYEQERVVLYCVAKAEGLELTEDEFIKRVTEYAESLGMTYAQILEIEDEKTLRQSMVMEAAMEHLLENIVVVDKEAE